MPRPPKPSDTDTTQSPRLVAATVAHRRNAARRYITKLHTTYPVLPLADRLALASLLVHGPDGETDR